MSSVRLSVSGQRSLTTTLNDPASTAATMPTKADDKMHLQIGNANEIRFVLPNKARIEVIAVEKDGEIGQDRHLRVVIPGGGAHLGVFCDSPGEDEEGHPRPGSWPHFSMDLGKHLRDYYGENYKVVEVLHERAEELLGVTPEPVEQ
jgi:hypothetical protein